MIGDIKTMKHDDKTQDSLTKQFVDEGNALALRRQEHPWLVALRNQGLAQFQQHGLPTQRLEDWKYSPISRFIDQHFAIQTTPQAMTAAQFQKHNALATVDCYRFVFVNGVLNLALSQLSDLPDGVILQDLQTALLADHAPLQSALANTAHQNKPSQHSLSALNTALMHSGVCLLVPDDCIVEKPVHILYIANSADTTFAAHIRNVILLGKNSQANVIEQYCSIENHSAYFNNAITDITLADNARLSHYKLALESSNAVHVASIRATQKRDGQFNSYSLASGGKLIRSDTHTLLQAPGSAAKLNGVFIAAGKHHIDHHTYIEHAASNTQSNENYKGILSDQGHGVFNGRVFVNEGATGTDAKQQNNNLLLSKDAEIDTKPQLEIFNDDVKCTHGATVGQLEQASLFYCQSRGLDVNTARLLLTCAFAQEAFACIEDATLRQQLNTIIENTLKNARAIS